MSDETMEHPIVEADEADDLAAFRKAIETGELEVQVGPAEVARRIASEIMDSPDLETAFKEGVTWPAQGMIGQVFDLLSLHLNLSSYGGGTPVYASVKAVDVSTGEVGILNTSAAKHLAKLYLMARDHRFPQRVRIVSSPRPTAAGYWPLDFELVEVEEG